MKKIFGNIILLAILNIELFSAKNTIELKIKNPNVYIGEPIKIDILLKHSAGIKSEYIKVSPIEVESFLIKSSKNPIKTIKNGIMTERYKYVLFAQKVGDFSVHPVELRIGKKKADSGGNFFNDPFQDEVDRSIEWKSIMSNSLALHVRSLPTDVELYGDYDLKVEIDKTEVDANKPINLTIHVKGTGNIDDMHNFVLKLDNIVVFSDKPHIESGLKNKFYEGEFSQKIALIADSNFTIPSLSIKYLDRYTKKIVIKKTEPINVYVRTKKSIEKPLNNPTKLKSTGVICFFIGLFLGILIGVIYIRFKQNLKSKKSLTMVQKVKKTKSDKELFDLLLPYGENSIFIQKKLEILENNIYKNTKSKIDKKEIIKYFIVKTYL